MTLWKPSRKLKTVHLGIFVDALFHFIPIAGVYAPEEGVLQNIQHQNP